MEHASAVASSKRATLTYTPKKKATPPPPPPKPAVVQADAPVKPTAPATDPEPPNKRRKITEQRIIPVQQQHMMSAAPDAATPALISDWKIGYDRHMYLVQYVNNNISFFIGEVMPNPGYNRSNKTIELTMDQFKVLYGMVLSGMAHARVGCPAPGTDHLTSMLPLGDDIFFVWSRFKKYEVATIRRFIKKPNGHVIALPSGFTFSEKYYNAICDVFRGLEPLKAVNKWMPNEEPIAPGFVFADSPMLLDAVARTMYNSISIKRTSTCPICIQYSRGDALPWNETRKMSGHTCVTQGCEVTVGNGPITNEEWTLAGKALQQDQIVEAYGLYEKQATIKEVLSFDYNKFLTENRNVLTEKINEYFEELVNFPDNIFGFANKTVTPML